MTFLITARCTIDDIPLAVRGGRDNAERFAMEFIAKLGETRDIDPRSELAAKLDFDPSEFIGCGLAEFDQWGELVSYRYLPDPILSDAAAVDAAHEQLTAEDYQLLRELGTPEEIDAATDAAVALGQSSMTPEEIVAHYKAKEGERPSL